MSTGPRQWKGPDIVGLVVSPDGTALKPGPVEACPIKTKIFERFCRELEAL
jgi:hypothetical protein